MKLTLLDYEPLDRCAYLGSAVSEVRSLLFDERRLSAQTLLLHVFVKSGGLDIFIDTLEWLWSFYLKYTTEHKKAEKEKDPDLDRISAALIRFGTITFY